MKDNQQKYINVINWWKERLDYFYPSPQMVPTPWKTPDFVQEAQRLVNDE